MIDDDTSEAAWQRHLAETERTLPPRYRQPGIGARPRAFGTAGWTGMGIVLVAVGLAGYGIARLFGWSP